MNRIKKIREISELACVFVVTSAMLIYGFGKFLQFENLKFLDKPVKDLAGIELMWAFYGYSKTYPLIIGFLQVAGGIMFFFKRTRVLGGLLLTSILINIILQDIFYEVNRGALFAAVVYQSLILIVLLLKSQVVIAGFRALLIENLEKKLILKERIIFWIGGLVLAGVIKYLEYILTH